MAPIPRTQAEIVQRIKWLETTKPHQFYGTEASRLLDALPHELAAEFLTAGSHDSTSWEAQPGRLNSAEQVRELMKSGLDLVWTRANRRKAMHVLRTLAHFRGLVWLLGSELDETYKKLADDFVYFGKPMLVVVSNLVGVDWRRFDDGKWVMADGDDPVSPGVVGF